MWDRNTGNWVCASRSSCRGLRFKSGRRGSRRARRATARFGHFVLCFRHGVSGRDRRRWLQYCGCTGQCIAALEALPPPASRANDGFKAGTWWSVHGEYPGLRQSHPSTTGDPGTRFLRRAWGAADRSSGLGLDRSRETHGSHLNHGAIRRGVDRASLCN
jgi:hypothetical protein